MNNNIIEDYCSFDVSKLLKEKGFDINIDSFYLKGEPILNGIKNPLFGYYKSDIVKRPTHALAIKWVRENFGIHISIQPVWYNKHSNIAYFYLAFENPEKEVTNHDNRFTVILEGSYQDVKGNYVNDEKYDKLLFETGFAFYSSQEATDAGLLYTLNNLIK